jgi:hypothetical protein
MTTDRTRSFEESRKKLEEIKKMYQEMQQLMLDLRVLGEQALEIGQSGNGDVRAIDLKARPIIERYVELQRLIPNQAELHRLQSELLLKDEVHGYLQ